MFGFDGMLRAFEAHSRPGLIFEFLYGYQIWPRKALTQTLFCLGQRL